MYIRCEMNKMGFQQEKEWWSSSSWSVLWVSICIGLLVVGSGAQTPNNGSRDGHGSICATAVLVYDYPCQEYLANTGDGYILSVQRIPGGRWSGGSGSRDPPNNRTPVVLQHGVLVDGRSWFYNMPEENLPMILADKGYDVWIANTRGTEYSRRHLYLDPKNKAFWYWTWDELAKFDFTAVIDLVHNITGQKVHYVGHALGALSCVAALADGYVGVDKLKSAALLSPTVYLNHIGSPLLKLAVKMSLAEMGASIGIYEFNLNNKLVMGIVKLLCSQPTAACKSLPAAWTGKNCCVSKTAETRFAKNGMASTTIRNLKHLSQNVRHGILGKYDYGNAEVNMQHYGARKPPIYELGRIPKGIPMFISHGGADLVADVTDMKILLTNLKPAVDGDKLRVLFVPSYAHYDFIMGQNAHQLVYTQLIAFLDQLK